MYQQLHVLSGLGAGEPDGGAVVEEIHAPALLMIILLLFLQKQNLAFAVYLFGSVLSSKRLFRGPSTNDMKK